MPKTFLQHIAVVLCKKRLQKTANIKNWEDIENGYQAKAIDFAKSSLWVKN